MFRYVVRKNIDVNFKEIFSKSEQLFLSINDEEQIKIKIFRIGGHEKYIINMNTKIFKTYFRFSTVIPFYGDFINQLNERFSKHKTILSSLYLLTLKLCVKSPISEPDFSLHSHF